ncbi:glycosyltransferase family 1 protein [Nocardioides sp. GY 10113]|uniref:glycosyltransferase n=1 Tax=Nocardioides sp. GY 10113 TaxID=2569761 RepID=UPI0010A8A722|nr:glycosyltransferase [Nocardioides sp. GY 10113]TIC86774.1 glycosyltransferase family 1 protein [Nocardioides sp. GY 10113]
MRITLVTETFYPAVDSTTTTIKATADRLLDLGHAVQIVAPGPGLASYRGCEVARVRPLEPTGSQIRDTLAGFRPDIVQVHSPRAVGRKAIKHASRLGLPTIAVEQSPVLDLAADYWRSRIAGRADLTLVTSSWMVARAAELGVHARAWAPGVDTAAFTPALRDHWLHSVWSKAKARRHTPALVVVGYVGALHKHHGVRRLAELAALEGIRPVLIGDGPERDWLQRRLPQAKLIGPLATGDLTVALPTLDVLVHPGTHETDGHVLREAGAAGVPVVAPRAGAAAEIVRHLETGVLYDPDRRGDLVRAVDSMAADRQRALLGTHARTVLAERTWHDAVEELVGHHYATLAPALA